MASSNGGSDFLSIDFLSFFLANRCHVKKIMIAILKTHKIIFIHRSGAFFTGKKGLILYIGCAKVSTSTLCTRTSKLGVPMGLSLIKTNCLGSVYAPLSKWVIP